MSREIPATHRSWHRHLVARRCFRASVFLVGICLLFVAPSSASAAVSFVSTEPLKVDFDDVATHAGRITVGVRNDDEKSQKIELRLSGLAAAAGADNPNLAELAPTSAVSEDVEPNKSAKVVLTLRTAARPKAGTYNATLVATGASGGSATRPVVLSVATNPTTNPVAGGETPRLQPQTLSDFSVGATNFIPSLISPVPAAMFTAGFLLFLLVWPFSGIWPFRQGRIRLPWLGLIIALALWFVVLGAYLSFGRDDGYYEGWSPHRIVANSPRVAPDASHGPVGTLVGTDGALAQAVVQEGQLFVKDLPRAGAYKGKIDLLPGATGGDATLTANVHDFWPYAFLVIAAGVLVGYGVTRYFTRTRVKTKRLLDAEELWSEAAREESLFAQTAPDLFPNFSVHRRLSAWRSEIERLLNSGDSADTTAAATKLASLRGYVEGVKTLWERLEALRGSINSIRDEVPKRFPVHPEDIGAVREAQGVFKRHLDDGVSRDEESVQLKAVTTKVDSAIGLIDEFTSSYLNVWSYLSHAAEIDPSGWSKHDRDALEKLEDQLQSAANEFLTASEEAKLKEAASSAGSTWLEINQLAEKAEPSQPMTLAFREAWAPPADVAEALKERGLLLPEERLTRPRTFLTVEIEGPDGPKEGTTGTVEDLFILRAKVEVPRLASPTKLHWSFGDGHESEPVSLAPVDERPVEISTAHRYERSGTFHVQLRDERGSLGEGVTIAVSPGPPHTAQMRTRLLVTDRDMTLASGLLAVLSGLLTLYMTSPTWGSPGDYLKAFLWGSTVSEGVKYVTALVARTGFGTPTA